MPRDVGVITVCEAIWIPWWSISMTCATVTYLDWPTKLVTM